MRTRKILALVGVLGLAATGCDYIVPPIDFNTATPAINVTTGWSGFVTGVSDKNGVHVDLAIENKTGDWSAMDLAYSKATVDGQTCTAVFFGTSVLVADGGWSIPDGFAMTGYTADGTGTIQQLFVECPGSKASAKKLHIDYRFATGAFNYFRPWAYNRASMDLDLTQVKSDLKFPVLDKKAKIEKVGDLITGINNCTVTLASLKRTADGIEFSWESANPTDYPAYVHIGNPPVLGADGILYGFYQSPHLALAPITPAKDKAAWTTTVAVPASVKGLYVLVPVESQQAKYFIDHALDITDK
jgi:hypothetical protein